MAALSRQQRPPRSSSPLPAPPSAPEQKATVAHLLGCGALGGLHAGCKESADLGRAEQGPEEAGSVPSESRDRGASTPRCPSGTIHIAGRHREGGGGLSQGPPSLALGDANTGPMRPTHQLRHVTSFTLVQGIQFSKSLNLVSCPKIWGLQNERCRSQSHPVAPSILACGLFLSTLNYRITVCDT